MEPIKCPPKTTKQNKAYFYVLKYLHEHPGHVDVLNAYFMDGFIENTGYKYSLMAYGANHCKAAGLTLSKMYKQRLLDRYRVGLRDMQYGFPKWVYVYEKTDSTTDWYTLYQDKGFE